MFKPNTPNLYHSDKILSLENLVNFTEEIKSRNKTIGLCVGGFDLIHPGHMKHLDSAKKFCDTLIVGITADEFVKKRKGEERPIYCEQFRAYSISQLISVDYAFISNYPKALEAIKILQPDYYIKGEDYIRSQTPGIMEERKAIEEIGGQMKYTIDEKFSTTTLVRYIKTFTKKPSILLVLDRDGTIIEERDFLGKNNNWREEIKFKEPVIDFIKSLDEKYEVNKIIVSNQTGVARKFFSEKRVKEINLYLDEFLKKEKIVIDDWQYCPYADEEYVLKNPDLSFDENYVLQESGRKPDTKLVLDSLKNLDLNPKQFDEVIVLGDRTEDQGLAKNLNGKYIDVKQKSFKDLEKEFISYFFTFYSE